MSIIGIDSGSSIIKIIFVDEKVNIQNKLLLEKMPIPEALDKFINLFSINMKEIEKIVVTGVGTITIRDSIHNIPVVKIDEFTAIGAGGSYLSKQDNILATNIGTGTAFVGVKNGEYKHIGGSRSWRRNHI